MMMFARWILLLSTFLGFQFCQKKPAIQSIRVLETKNETVRQLVLSLKDSMAVQVKLTNLNSGVELFSFPTPKGYNHKILLPGLKSDQRYAFQIMTERKLITDPDTFRTSKIPVGLVRLELKQHTPKSFEGYLLTQRRLVKGSVYMIDNEGEVVWYQKIPGQPKLANWTESNEILVLYGSPYHNNSAGDQITRYALTGDISYQLDLQKINLVAHHEIMEFENDLLLLVYDTKKVKTKSDGEIDVTSSAIVRLSKKEKILWKWSTFDVKNPENDPDIANLREDWGHANAFSLDSDGHVLVSQRDWNQVWKINSRSGELIWIMGENGTIQMDSVDVFSGQHAIYKNINDKYMLFDNGRKNRKSRVMSFELNGDKAKKILSIDLPDDLYADRMGNVRLLPNGDVLLCSPRSRSILVLDTSGSLLFHVTLGIPDPYRVEYVPSFYEVN